MPLKTWNTQADWDVAYDCTAEPDGHPGTRQDVRVGYVRAVLFPDAVNRAAKLAELFGWTPAATRLVIFGAGYGWLAEALAVNHGLSVAALDTSTLIQANKGRSDAGEIEARITAAGLDPRTGRGAEIRNRLVDGFPRSRITIYNEDLSNNASRNRIKQQAFSNGTPTDCLSEFVLESLTDAECTAASQKLHAFSPTTRIIHCVVTIQPGNTSGYNWKTLEQWKALLPADTFVEAGSWRVL